MADVKQIQQMIPFITSETAFRQHVCKLVFGIDIFDWDLGLQIDSVKEPIKSNSVGSRHMSHSRTSSFNYHFDHGFVVLIDVQLSVLVGT